MLLFEKNDNIIFNQLRLKLLYKSKFKEKKINIALAVNLNAIKSYVDNNISENLFFLEFVTSIKGMIKNYKKNYHNMNVYIIYSLRKEHMYFFMNLLKMFYFPIIKRRNDNLLFYYDPSYNISFYISTLKDMPFMSNIYYNYDNPIIVHFYFNSNIKDKSLLLLNYYTSLYPI